MASRAAVRVTLAITAASILAFLAVAPYQTLLATPDDELWQKGLRIIEANGNWLPDRIHQVERVYNEDGELEETSHIMYEVVLAADGPELRMMSASTDGENSIEEKREEESGDFLEELLFAGGSSVHGDHRANAVGSATVQGNHCRQFTVEETSGNSPGTLRVWLSEATGVPLRLDLFDPQVESFSGGKIWNTRMSFNYNPSTTAWYPVRMVLAYQLELEIIPGLRFRGRVHNTVTFAAYRSIGQ